MTNVCAHLCARKTSALVGRFERGQERRSSCARPFDGYARGGTERNTAFHESGHAVVRKLLPKTDPVHKVTIIPRGRALGVTMQLPEQDRYSMDRDRLLSTIAVLFGGRIARNCSWAR